MSYPQIVEYNDAIQSPDRALADPILRIGRVRTNQLGLPLALSGGFALTYDIEAVGRRFAVRCFHREVPGIEARYAAVSKYLLRLKSRYFVDFDFQPTGIRISGRGYPIIKMDWIEGDTLGVFVGKHARNRAKIMHLRDEFLTLTQYLAAQGVAHGDLQNENIILENESLRLIDYDGMYVPPLPLGKGSEIGHKHFQHPARSTSDFGPEIDRFSSLTIDLSLRVIAEAPALQARFSEGGTTLIFRANDFADPSNSEAFDAVFSLSKFKSEAERFANICQSPVSAVPSLDDFLAGKGGIDRPVAALRTATQKKGYIPAFRVMAASSFAEVESCVGQRGEMIGQIMSVKMGRTKGGHKRGGKPYAFVNFGDWRQNSVKLTIWSEALSKMSSVPDDSWIGRWVSVTGLIEPPYRGTSYVNIGITIGDGSEIVFITASEAAYRLQARGDQAASPASQNSVVSNRDVLAQLRSGADRPMVVSSRAATKTSRSTSKVQSSANQQILANLRQSSGIPTTQPTQSKPAPKYRPASAYNPAPKKGSGTGVPWGWIIFGIFMLFVIFGRSK